MTAFIEWLKFQGLPEVKKGDTTEGNWYYVDHDWVTVCIDEKIFIFEFFQGTLVDISNGRVI